MMMIQVTVHNDDPNDLYVSVWDQNQAGSPAVWNKRRLNADEAKTIQIQPDGGGTGDIKWEAIRVDNGVTKPGQAQPSSNDTVDVDVFGV
jgi:hypothetical protein